MTWEQLFDITTGPLGVLAVLLLILWSGAKARPLWVYGRVYQQMEDMLTEKSKEAVMWRDIALQNLPLLDRALTVAEKSAQ